MQEGKRKNKSLTTLAILGLLIVMICVVSISNTFAKYTSSFAGEDSARVAKWSWEINDVAVSNDDNLSIDLFSTVKEADGLTAETDVAAANGTDKVIAPGTGGSFELGVTNNSEVTAKYSVAFDVTDATGINLEFKVNEGQWSKTLAAVDATTIAKNGGEDTVTVYWRWVYDDETNSGSNDANDTTLGEAGTAMPKVKATLNLVQVD